MSTNEFAIHYSETVERIADILGTLPQDKIVEVHDYALFLQNRYGRMARKPSTEQFWTIWDEIQAENPVDIEAPQRMDRPNPLLEDNHGLSL